MGEASKLSVQGLWWDSLGRRDTCNGIRVTQVFFHFFRTNNCTNADVTAGGTEIGNQSGWRSAVRPSLARRLLSLPRARCIVYRWLPEAR